MNRSSVTVGYTLIVGAMIGVAFILVENRAHLGYGLAISGAVAATCLVIAAICVRRISTSLR